MSMNGQHQGVFLPTALFIPGLLSDARVWAPVSDSLAGGMKVYNADVSAMTGIAAAAAGLLAAVDGPLLPVGHSMGGRIALEMARQAPGRMAGLILADTGHHPLRPGEVAKREEMIALGHRDMAALADAWLPPMLHPDRAGDAALMDDLRAMVLAAGPEVHERQIRALIGRPDAAPHLGAIAAPVLLLVGRQDGWSPVAQHEEIAAAVADAEVVVIEDAGHFAPAEQPQAVVAAVQDWLHRKGLMP